MSFVRVALDVPIDTLFDYQAPRASKEDIGKRVLVSFGNRTVTGVILGVSEHPSVALRHIKSILRIFDDIPPLTNDLIKLASFCSHYYHHPIGGVVLNILPPRLRSSKPVVSKSICRLSLTPIAEIHKLPSRAIAKRKLLGLITGGALLSNQVPGLSSTMKKALKEFIALGWISFETINENKNKPNLSVDFRVGPKLNDAQQAALRTIGAELDRFHVWLLHGITGSGKTEIYFNLINKVLEQRGQVLILVPEINLTPQLEALFKSRFLNTRFASLHSGLNETERLDNWLGAQNGDVQIVLGTRLAIFTPMKNLRLIIIDEEHDSSFKQLDGLRYSARDVAIYRAQQHRIPIVLGSATPSLETYYHAITGRYHLLPLNTRAGGSILPSIELLDTSKEKLFHGLSKRLLAEISTAVARGEQALVYINRRGYAPTLLCRNCNWAANCHRCSAKLVLHLIDKKVRCHHCGHHEPIPGHCPTCGNQELVYAGQGTQRIEEALNQNFPGMRILRIDRDTTRKKAAWNSLRQNIHDHKVDILIGTQIMAKGHDFPKLNFVGILNADRSLFSSNFRAEEQLFAQLMQVAGRAGRGKARGKVILQTEFPHHPLYQALLEHDYIPFAEFALKERRRAKLPPFCFQALLKAEGQQPASVAAFLKKAVDSAPDIDSSITIYGPVEASLRRVAGHERAHVLIQSSSRKRLQSFLHAWCKALTEVRSSKVRWALDVDPLEF